ncbi:MAG TPA: hypothetical protein VK420_21925 [Longimicrobium sp.]|jgi:hypothetical protein|nr:hypothetical protein [Longimicrobium sp.]
MNVVRYVQLRREVEYLCSAALDTAGELDRCEPEAEEAPYLAQALIHLSLKISYLLWRFGRRITDRYGAAEAERLRSLLGLDDASPLAPGGVSPLVELITMPDHELIGAFRYDSLSIQAGGALRPLRPLVPALEQICARLGATATQETTLAARV